MTSSIQKIMAESYDDNLNREIEVWSIDKTPEQILIHAPNMRKNPMEAKGIIVNKIEGKKIE